MHKEIKNVQVLDHNKNKIAARFSIYEESPDNEDLVLLELQFNIKKYTATDKDFFTAMITIRKQLEVEGFLLNCYGSSKQVYASGMALSMGYGRKAYKLTLNEPSKTSDLVDIFETEERIEFATIKEQQDFYEMWIKSIIKHTL